LYHSIYRGRRGRDHMVTGFTTYAIKYLSPLMLWDWISNRARCTTLCDKVCHWLAAGWWFSPGAPFSSTNKIDRHDITEILLKVAFLLAIVLYVLLRFMESDYPFGNFKLFLSPLQFPHKHNVHFDFTFSCLFYLRYLCLLAHSGDQHILCCVFCFACLRLVSGVHNVTSFSWLSIRVSLAVI
jgi:hypothetical protein